MKPSDGRIAKRYRRVAAIALAAAASCIFLAPEVLAFPYRAQVGGNTVYSAEPIRPEITGIIARADALVAASPIMGPGYGHRIFLTGGGWRWYVLSIGASGAFALSKPVSGAIFVNRADVGADRVTNGRTIGGVRSLSGVIAHERTHGLIRARYGILADLRYPAWLREGYCDLVAGGGSLSDAEARALIRQGRTAPALDYYLGRKRVEAALRANGNSVDRLFAG